MGTVVTGFVAEGDEFNSAPVTPDVGLRQTPVREAGEFDTFGVAHRLKIIHVGFHPTLLNLSPSASPLLKQKKERITPLLDLRV
jgi:hypothetical protein